MQTCFDLTAFTRPPNLASASSKPPDDSNGQPAPCKHASNLASASSSPQMLWLLSQSGAQAPRCCERTACSIQSCFKSGLAQLQPPDALAAFTKPPNLASASSSPQTFRTDSPLHANMFYDDEFGLTMYATCCPRKHAATATLVAT